MVGEVCGTLFWLLGKSVGKKYIMKGKHKYDGYVGWFMLSSLFLSYSSKPTIDSQTIAYKTCRNPLELIVMKTASLRNLYVFTHLLMPLF